MKLFKNLQRLVASIVLFSFLFTFTVTPVFAAITYSYDAAGNMTSDGHDCYTYNQANQLTKVTKCSTGQLVAEYVYDYQGNRIKKKEYSAGALKKTIYSLGDEYETVKLASSGATQNTTYYKVNDELVARKNPDGGKTYYVNDHLGSTSVLTDANGNLVERSTYEPYGEVKSGGVVSKFQYTGQEKDQETTLNYYNSRYYDPHIRRFTQPDYVIQNLYDPQYLNRYSYVRNNPLKYTDPTGHVSILDYNNMLSNPTVQKYNILMGEFAAISGNTANKGFSPVDPKLNAGVKGYYPEMDKGGAKDVAKPFYNSMIGNDIKTIRNPNSTLAEKGWAGVGIVGAIYIPEVKIFKASKVIDIVDLGKVVKAEDEINDGMKVIKAGDEIKNGIKAGEFQFSQLNPGRIDEYHGISLDGTSQGLFTSGEPYSHTVWKNGEVVFHRDQFGNDVIQTWR